MLLPDAWDFVSYWCEPPVETPSMKSPRLRTWYVPVKHVDTLRISSLSRGLVPFIVSSPSVGFSRKLVLRVTHRIQTALPRFLSQ